MGEAKGIVGGFVGSNEKNGQIVDCYSVMKFNGKKYKAGGFVGNNQGRIASSYCEGVATGLEGGFVGEGASLAENCYFINRDEKTDKKLDKYWDRAFALNIGNIQSKEDAVNAGFNMEKTWKYTGKTPVLQFEDSNWICEDELFVNGDKKYAVIKNAETLLKFAEGVNQGNSKYVHARVRLDADIDLGGKKWTPIGNERKNAFKGVFDGNGYSVKNFVIGDKNSKNNGFFGYLDGEVYNLIVDCEIKGDGCFGAIAAVNNGTIGCCGAVVGIYGKGNKINAGGLAGTNAGRIFKCYVAGRMKFLVVPVVQIAVIIAILLLSGTTIFAVSNKMNNKGIFNEVPTDSHQEKISDANADTAEKTTEVSDPLNEMHSMSFGLDHMVKVDLSENSCTVEFRNPEGEYKIKMELRLEVNGEEVVVATSGAVSPGYLLRELYLSEYACLNLEPGEYTATMALIPYDEDSNEKAMVETTLPVELIVQE